MRNEIPKNIGDYLEYDLTSSTGLRWKKARQKINVGDTAGCLKKDGYYRITFNKREYKNHRIIYFLHHGYCPECLDHIDGKPKNNNINNLREATISQNNHNSRIPKNNTTGIKGLSIKRNKNYPDIQYWCLQITKNKKIAFQEYHLKTEKTKDECRIILEAKRLELHGKFTNNG